MDWPSSLSQAPSAVRTAGQGVGADPDGLVWEYYPVLEHLETS